MINSLKKKFQCIGNELPLQAARWFPLKGELYEFFFGEGRQGQRRKAGKNEESTGDPEITASHKRR